MKKLNRCKIEELSNFETLMKPMVDWINKTWKCADLKPKGWDDFIKDYEDYQGMEGLDEQIRKDYEGLWDETATTSAFPIMTSLPHVAYSDINQDSTPLHQLMGACVRFGMLVQERRDELNNPTFDDEKMQELLDLMRKKVNNG